jgi:hypothetical protein
MNPLIALMVEVATIYEASLNFYQTSGQKKTENSHLHGRRSENLK